MDFGGTRLSLSQVDEHLAVCPEAEQDCPFKHYGCTVKVRDAFLFLPLHSTVEFVGQVYFTL